MDIITRKLLVEDPIYDLQYVVEEKNNKEPSTLYIQGPYLMSEQKNKNGRIYNLHEMVSEVNRYTDEMIKKNRSIGELNHPTSVEVNPERACHMVVELKQDGNMFLGKSKVLSTPMGQLVRCLVMDNVRLGISSRALGQLLPGTSGEHTVKGFHLICNDVVHDPSVPSAFVNGILESKSYILEKDGSIAEAYEKLEKTISTLPRKTEVKEEVLRECIAKFLKALTKK